MTALALQQHEPARNGLDFLRDGRGIYGLDFRDKLESWVGPSSGALVIRPDKLHRENTHLVTNVALQPIPLSRSLFKHSTERSMARNLGMILFEESTSRDGIDPWAGPGKIALDDERVRKKFFGCCAKAHRVTNFLIRQLLTEAGDERAIRLARRFRPKWRGSIYYLATRSARLSQVCETFPYLAWALSEATLRGRSQEFPIQPVTEAIEVGRPLRRVAELAGIPFPMRAIPPLAATLASGLCDLFRRNPHLIEQMPKGARAASAWVGMLDQAHAISPDFAEWCAKNVEMKPPYAETTAEIGNVGDWVKASYEKHVQAAIDDLAQKLQSEVPVEYVNQRLNDPFHTGSGADLVSRSFKPCMSEKTVRWLSEGWHDAVAKRQFSGDRARFPKAWAPKSEIDGYEFAPIGTPLALYHEGRAMHNCVTTYSHHIRGGTCYLFSLQKGDKRVATVEIGRDSDGFHLGHFAGPCNQRVDKKAERIIRKWARSTKFKKEEEPRPRPELRAGMEWCPANGADLDDEIPF